MSSKYEIWCQAARQGLTLNLYKANQARQLDSSTFDRLITFPATPPFGRIILWNCSAGLPLIQVYVYAQARVSTGAVYLYQSESYPGDQ